MLFASSPNDFYGMTIYYGCLQSNSLRTPNSWRVAPHHGARQEETRQDGKLAVRVLLLSACAVAKRSVGRAVRTAKPDERPGEELR